LKQKKKKKKNNNGKEIPNSKDTAKMEEEPHLPFLLSHRQGKTVSLM
jgi:hypothetical protein